jgi:hypothetical protein
MTPHHLELYRVLIVMLCIAGLIFWRAAVKIIIGALIILMVVLAAAFMLGFFQGLYHAL